jgi:hypothetical protein
MLAWAIANFTSFLAQIALFVILKGFGKSQPKKVEKKPSQIVIQEKLDSTKSENEFDQLA